VTESVEPARHHQGLLEVALHAEEGVHTGQIGEAVESLGVADLGVSLRAHAHAGQHFHG
jgi:hypothetical protein